MEDYKSLLLEKLELKYPLLAVYDSPDKSDFENLIEPISGKKTCLFAYFNSWKKGKTLRLSKENSSCRGCGYWWFGKENRSREDFVKFLAEEEGLKHSNKDMEQWLIDSRTYKPENESIFVGPLRKHVEQYVKTITFWVNADQLSVLNIANYYFFDSVSSPTTIVPFGSGCMQALTLFEDTAKPQAIIGSMDLAMRQYIPPNIFAFTVTLPLFKMFLDIDEDSFLRKPFLDTLLKSRDGSIN